MRTLIVGLGSAHGDDQAGWLVAKQLRDFANQNSFELQIAKSPVDLLDWIDGTDRLVICDACHGAGQVGQLRRWSWPAPEIAEVSMSGTHNLALPAVLALAEKLGRLPGEVVIWAIEGAVGQSEVAVSPAVQESVSLLVARIVSGLESTPTLQAKACTNNH